MPVGLYTTRSEQTAVATAVHGSAGLHQVGSLRARAALSSGNFSCDCHVVYLFLSSTTYGLPVWL